VLAESFERIHRSNLIGMGVLPLQFMPGENAETLGLSGEETFSFLGVDSLTGGAEPQTIRARADDRAFEVTVRLDTAREHDYYRHGGIMKYVMRSILTAAPS